MIGFKRNNSVPLKSNLQKILNSFSNKQTTTFVVLLLILTISAISILGKINKKFMHYLPEVGGTLTEGVIGTPRFVNPVLAISDTDKDLTGLIYSGLMKKNPDGTMVTDLAENYTVSPDGLTYTFKIKSNSTFHDKYPLTANDVVFTIEKIKDSLIKSPMQAVWQGVSVSEDDKDPYVVIFNLSEPYAAFLDNLTIGILPKHIWDNFDSEEFNLTEFNLKAIGSGPYKINNIKERNNGLIEEIELSLFKNYSGQKPFIKNINFKFYKNENDLIKAYKKGNVDQISSIHPESAKALKDSGFTPTTATLSRVFGLFFNPNQNEILRDKELIKAIELGINKENIIKEVLYGFGIIIDNPVPGSFFNTEKDITPYTNDKALAEKILEQRGYKITDSGFRSKDGKILEFSISTADVAELRFAAELIKQDLESIGIKTNIKIFEVGILNQNIIRPREYEALMFGQVIRNESDLFAFWHSSQRNDPGLNISVYTNSKVDRILEELISTNDELVKQDKLEEFIKIINEDKPAIFLYSPQFIYMESPKVKNVILNQITSSSERFMSINKWYIREDAVWKIWLPKEEIIQ